MAISLFRFLKYSLSTLNERVIVPRSHIAELLRDAQPVGRLIRGPFAMCSTCARAQECLAILAAKLSRSDGLNAVDLSRRAGGERRNVKVMREERVRLIQSGRVFRIQEKYDLIISNPPYVNAGSMASPDEYRREPEMALASGPDGLDFVRVLLKEAPHHLTDGVLVGNRPQQGQRVGARLSYASRSSGSTPRAGVVSSSCSRCRI